MVFVLWLKLKQENTLTRTMTYRVMTVFLPTKLDQHPFLGFQVKPVSVTRIHTCITSLSMISLLLKMTLESKVDKTCRTRTDPSQKLCILETWSCIQILSSEGSGTSIFLSHTANRFSYSMSIFFGEFSNFRVCTNYSLY